MSTVPFAPMYILPNELAQFGLPDPTVQSDIYNLIQFASSMIDIECGRIDGDGNGSLVYTTYTQRDLLQTRNRNLVYVQAKPMVAVSQSTSDLLLATATGTFVSGLNYSYTGAQVSTAIGPNGTPTAIIGASGRYGYTRQDMSVAYPDLWAFINPLNLLTLFGGPAPWIPIDITQTDYDHRTGEIWIPAGLQLQRYSEILIQYTSGYNPLAMPRAIKFVCASIVKRALASDGTTGLMSLMVSQGGVNASFAQKYLDPTLDAMLQPYRVVRAY
ncbi:MAG: hypothetical protein KGL39_37305 [Patescibacteria group bacterium]|nr:hypothetical protein [Patescibacteria group bacterium]